MAWSVIKRGYAPASSYVCTFETKGVRGLSEPVHLNFLDNLDKEVQVPNSIEALGLLLAEEVERKVTQNREVPNGMVLTNPALVLVEDGIDPPMAPGGLTESFGLEQRPKQRELGSRLASRRRDMPGIAWSRGRELCGGKSRKNLGHVFFASLNARCHPNSRPHKSPHTKRW